MSPFESLLEGLEALGARVLLVLPNGDRHRIGRAPARAEVRLTASAFEALRRADHLALAEAYLRGEAEVEGELSEVLRVVELLEIEASALSRLGSALLALGRGGRRHRRDAIAFHYDRPAEFFLPWFERWRSYSHGLYLAEDDDPAQAQARKFQRVIDTLGLKPGARVLDVGAGWGGFIEYAGLQGVCVDGITISAEQHRFVAQLLRERELPCTIRQLDLFDLRARAEYDAVVFMGSLEHLPRYRVVARVASRALVAGGGVYADFCSRSEGHHLGEFMSRYIWPGPARYVDIPALIGAFERESIRTLELHEETQSYALTVRDWARALEREAGTLTQHFGSEPVRAFLLYLWSAHHFLRTGRTRAYHWIGRKADPGGLEAA